VETITAGGILSIKGVDSIYLTGIPLVGGLSVGRGEGIDAGVYEQVESDSSIFSSSARKNL
jgi:hypothetical protein